MKSYLLTGDGRLRVNSFSFHPYLYGFLLNTIALISIFFYQNIKQIKVSKRYILTLIALFIINLYFSNSRIILLIFIGSYGIYALFSITAERFFQYILILPLLIIVLFQIPKVSKTMDQLADVVLTGGSSTEGSSVDMRQTQLLLSFKYFNDSPIFGNGFDYIIENLGFSSDNSKRSSDAEAFGFESYFFVLLIEQGLIGIIANLILFVSLLVYYIRNFLKTEREYRRFVLICLLILIGYLTFILTTGVLSSMPFFFTLTGLFISIQVKMLSRAKNIRS
ncbi:O-antigen ligase family protein [Mucilaginibacter flavus]|uniref:O-antigen ligase family protein n=1 Tax=Mucilaginibacter flavus TaxID=931504 RepID=UPI0025B482AD|nr:O-antigen ligase family protein [Mucilaginibacter flavus]MDN3583738.1 O-antigen ligase family protein [Mucilaginibacter flavus]